MPNSPQDTTMTQLHDLFRDDAISPDTRIVNERLAATLAALTPPADLGGVRKAYADGSLGLPASPRSPRARQISIDGPGGPINLRLLTPETVHGVYLHFHGGSWMVGGNDTWDGLLEQFGRDAGMAAVSVDYRLAPEHIFPAAVEDCVAAALWLIENAEAVFGTSWLSIGGESAGAHLAASTLIRLRDLGAARRFQAANLLFGVFDLSLTPSARASSGTPFIDGAVIAQSAAAFGGGMDLRDPAISPLYADLRDLPPALFTVGTVDPLVDDSLFMHMRWQAAGNLSELAVYPGGPHGFNSLDSVLARSANHRMARFLAERRSATT